MFHTWILAEGGGGVQRARETRLPPIISEYGRRAIEGWRGTLPPPLPRHRLSAGPQGCERRPRHGPRSGLPPVILHDVKQPAAWSDRAADLVPAAHLRARVGASVSLYLHRISAAFTGASAGSRPSPWRQLQLRPRNEGAGGAPGGVLALTVALVRRDATLARRGPSRATGTPPLGAPPWRCRPRNRSGPVLRIRPEGYSRPAIVHGGLRHRAFRSRAYRRGETPLPAPPAGSSPETAPHEQGWRILYCIFVK